MSNTGLIFWEIVTLLVLLALIYRFVYPPIRDRIRPSTQRPIERASIRPRTNDRIGRLRRALLWRRTEPSRFGLWALVVVWAVVIVLQVFQLVVYPPGWEFLDLAMVVAGLGLISLVTGDLAYPGGRRTLAALLWLAAIVLLFPLGFGLMAAQFYSEGQTLGMLLLAIILLVMYGGLLGRYLWAGNTDARRG